MENKKRCLYRKLDNDIREYVFTEASNAAVDEWIDWLDRIVIEDLIPEGSTDRLLFDTRQSGPLPMYYTFKKLTEWRQKNQPYDQNRYSRVAQLYNSNSFYVTMAKNLMKIFPMRDSKMEYFFNDRDAAVAWLLRGD